MIDEVAGDHLQAPRAADHRLQLRPLALQPLLAGDLLALGDLLEVLIDPWLLGLGQIELGEPALVVDRHGRPILDRALDVVDVDVVPEDGAGVSVIQLDRRPREADERRARQSVADVFGESLDEAVLASVGLIGDDDDVPPVGEPGKGVPLLLRQELLDRGEDNAAGGPRQVAAELCPIFHLDRSLAQQLLARREHAKELIVEVVSVRDDDDGRVLELRSEDELAREEGHGEALAGPLGVPDDAAPAVPVRAGCSDSRGDRLPGSVELVVAGDDLPNLGVVLERDEVPDEVEEAALLKDALGRHLQAVGGLRRQLPPLDRPPRQEPLSGRGKRAHARVHPVRHDDHLVVAQESRNLLPIGLDLPVRRPDVGVFVGRILQLDQAERQTVNEDDDVGPAVAASVDGELVHGQPAVVVRVVEVDQSHLDPPDAASIARNLDLRRVHQHPMERTVVDHERRRLRPQYLPKGFFACGQRHVWIELLDRASEAVDENDVSVAIPFGARSTGRDLATGARLVIQLAEPDHKGSLGDGLVDARDRLLEKAHRLCPCGLVRGANVYLARDQPGQQNIANARKGSALTDHCLYALNERPSQSLERLG